MSEQPVTPPPPAPPETVTTRHELVVDGTTLRYTADVGAVVIDDDKGVPAAEIHYIAYLLDDHLPAGGRVARPLTFAYNGGPGASSLWVHLGALGPRRINYGDGIRQPDPPFRFEENPHSWLRFTDLVFIDPVGTGFSKAIGEKDPKDYWGVDDDGAVLADFVRRFLSRYDRWRSPKWLAGESYGGPRAVVQCRSLQQDMGVDLAGLVLISPAVDYTTISFAPGNHVAALCALPSYAAVAHHHGCLSPERQASLDETLRTAETFALSTYLPALAQGSGLPADERRRCGEAFASLTGLSVEFVEDCRMYVTPARFCKELLRSRGKTIGRFDSRLTGTDYDDAGEYVDYDPADVLTTGPFVAAFNDMLRRDLGVRHGRTYRIQDSEIIKAWRWHEKPGKAHGFVNLTPVLRKQLAINEGLRVLFTCGLYDVATPYYASRYVVNAMGLTEQMARRVAIRNYPGGHMMYTDQAIHERLTADVQAFYEGGP